MATTTILLREEVENLGGRGDIVKVKAGFARNFLLPRKLAVQATSSNVRQIEREREKLLQREEAERTAAQGRAGQLQSLNLGFERRVGEHGILYGSVTSMDIAEALRERGYEIDRRRISLGEPIKEVGDFSVAVRLHRDVTVQVPVRVMPEGGATTAPEATDSTQSEPATTDDATAATTSDVTES